MDNCDIGNENENSIIIHKLLRDISLYELKKNQICLDRNVIITLLLVFIWIQYLGKERSKLKLFGIYY